METRDLAFSFAEFLEICLKLVKHLDGNLTSVTVHIKAVIPVCVYVLNHLVNDIWFDLTLLFLVYPMIQTLTVWTLSILGLKAR